MARIAPVAVTPVVWMPTDGWLWDECDGWDESKFNHSDRIAWLSAVGLTLVRSCGAGLIVRTPGVSRHAVVN